MCSLWEEEVSRSGQHSLYKHSSFCSDGNQQILLVSVVQDLAEIHCTIYSNIFFCDCPGFLLQINFADDEILTVKLKKKRMTSGKVVELLIYTMERRGAKTCKLEH